MLQDASEELSSVGWKMCSMGNVNLYPKNDTAHLDRPAGPTGCMGTASPIGVMQTIVKRVELLENQCQQREL